MIGEPINNYNSGFSDGYSKGFQDGYQVGKLSGFMNNKSDSKSCSVCGMSFVDEMGRPKIMGYVCPHDHCPSRITCSTDHIVENVGHIKTFSTGQFSISDPGPVTDGLSYEEIYGSVVYQQNKKKDN